MKYQEKIFFFKKIKKFIDTLKISKSNSRVTYKSTLNSNFKSYDKPLRALEAGEYKQRFGALTTNTIHLLR